jgi:hypothetical protein
MPLDVYLSEEDKYPRLPARQRRVLTLKKIRLYLNAASERARRLRLESLGLPAFRRADTLGPIQ